ncbi:unnamed protein product [Spirodela intermedia]|uniref:Uncharacterized protein n=1 Tax=Spirodela intermedia TaxID=51605 RepID=A0A7I8K959_SPIIN|nr:unnamed protein product [Spirodela intermedia]
MASVCRDSTPLGPPPSRNCTTRRMFGRTPGSGSLQSKPSRRTKSTSSIAQSPILGSATFRILPLRQFSATKSTRTIISSGWCSSRGFLPQTTSRRKTPKAKMSLRREISQRAYHASHLRIGPVVVEPRQAEVPQFRLHVAVEQYIPGFDVSVDDNLLPLFELIEAAIGHEAVCQKELPFPPAVALELHQVAMPDPAHADDLRHEFPHPLPRPTVPKPPAPRSCFSLNPPVASNRSFSANLALLLTTNTAAPAAESTRRVVAMGSQILSAFSLFSVPPRGRGGKRERSSAGAVPLTPKLQPRR